MDSTITIDARQLERLAARLSTLDDALDDADKVALLAVFALAGEALDARLDEKAEVSGFAQGGFDVGLQVGVPPTLPGLGDGLLDAVGGKGIQGRKAGKGQHEYLVVKMSEVFITGVQ